MHYRTVLTIALLCMLQISSFRLQSVLRHDSYWKVMQQRHNEGNKRTFNMMVDQGGEAVKTARVPGKSQLNCRVVGVGACPGQVVVENQAFESLVDTNDEWISSRTGIRRRHVIQPGSSLRDLCVQASRNALVNAQVNAHDIDLVILATSSPDDLFGDSASVATAIGATRAVAFDLTAACSGFLFGLVTASQFLHSGAYSKVLVIGGDALTRFLNWEDRNTCILFGDGAGAMVLESTASTSSKEESGVLGFALHSDGSRYCSLKLPFNSHFTTLSNKDQTIVDQGQYGQVAMNGMEVYKFVVREVPVVIKEALLNANLKVADVDWLLLHQANARIMDDVAATLGISRDKVLCNIDEYGNTSAGSIPLALTEAVQSGNIKKGDVIAMAGFGAGLSWGAAIIRWDGRDLDLVQK